MKSLKKFLTTDSFGRDVLFGTIAIIATLIVGLVAVLGLSNLTTH